MPPVAVGIDPNFFDCVEHINELQSQAVQQRWFPRAVRFQYGIERSARMALLTWIKENERGILRTTLPKTAIGIDGSNWRVRQA
jgi:hypothetical protein